MHHLPACLLPSPAKLEVLSIQLLLCPCINICAVYVPPASCENYWLSLLAYFRKLFSSNIPTFVLGDFNCPDINWPMLSASSKVSSLLCDLIFDLHLSQVVDSSTHIKGNILDLVISNSADRISNIKVHQNHPMSSDHFLVSFSIKVVRPRTICPQPSVFLNYSRADFNGMCDFLLDWDFSACYESSNVHMIWSLLKSAISTAIDKFVPLVSCSSRHSSLPKWFNQDLRHGIKCLRTLRRKYNVRPTPYLLSKLSQSELQLRANIDHAKTCYESKLINDFALGRNSRIYSHIRSVLQQDQLPSQMFLKSVSAVTDIDKANLFNRYFFSIYSSNSSSLPNVSSIPCPSTTISDIDFSPLDVYNALASLDPTKAMGIDGVGPRVLRFCACALYLPIHHLFQTSLRYSQLPSEWCLHCITPIYKSGDRSLISNYRPISLLCSVSKVLERLIYDKIIDFISQSISVSQFGFLNGKSTLQQLLVFLHLVHNNISNKLQTDVIYLDFRKAFDSVPHDRLLIKLRSMGITGNLWCWFQAYLSSRFQLVSVNRHHSNTLPVTSGVPQGSILGPLLFLVFINDIPTLVKSARLLLFADDTKCVKSVKDHSDCSHLQSDLDSLYIPGAPPILPSIKKKQSFSDFQLVPVLFLLNTFWTTRNYFLLSAIVILVLLSPMTFPGQPIITRLSPKPTGPWT